MFAIKVMDFYVKISDVFPDNELDTTKKVEYVRESTQATTFPKASEAAIEAESMEISGFAIDRL
jgi:hypothetical protein